MSPYQGVVSYTTVSALPRTKSMYRCARSSPSHKRLGKPLLCDSTYTSYVAVYSLLHCLLASYGAIQTSRERLNVILIPGRISRLSIPAPVLLPTSRKVTLYTKLIMHAPAGHSAKQGLEVFGLSSNSRTRASNHLST